MNYKIAFLGLLEIVSSISIGIFILALTYVLLKYIGRKYYDIQQGNMAFGIYIASIMFSAGFMVSSVIQPLISSFRLINNDVSTFNIFLIYIGRGSLYISIAYIAAILISLIGTSLYAKLTPLDEFKEIKDNNIGVALIVSSIIITLTLMTKSGVTLLIESIIPYPELPPR